MPKAARHTDEIGHSPTMSWLMKGLMIGAAIAVAGVLIAGTGGLAAVAIVGGVAAGGAGIGEMMSTMSFAPNNFRETEAFKKGDAGQREVALWFQQRGWYVTPSYDYSGEKPRPTR